MKDTELLKPGFKIGGKILNDWQTQTGGNQLGPAQRSRKAEPNPKPSPLH